MKYTYLILLLISFTTVFSLTFDYNKPYKKFDNGNKFYYKYRGYTRYLSELYFQNNGNVPILYGVGCHLSNANGSCKHSGYVEIKLTVNKGKCDVNKAIKNKSSMKLVIKESGKETFNIINMSKTKSLSGKKTSAKNEVSSRVFYLKLKDCTNEYSFNYKNTENEFLS